MDNVVTTSGMVCVQCCWFYCGPGVVQMKGEGEPLAVQGVGYPEGVLLHGVPIKQGVLAPAAGL